MVHITPESPCSPDMSPSSTATDLANKCETAGQNLTSPVQDKVEAEVKTKDEEDVLSEMSDTESTITLNNVRVRIEKRPNPLRTSSEEIEYETVILPEITLPESPTLDNIRDALLQCELGRPERDIFFPTWTKSLYISWRQTVQTSSSSSSSSSDDKESAKRDDSGSKPRSPTTESVSKTKEEALFTEQETIDTDALLKSAISREHSKPGSLCLHLQECRNARYSRKRDKQQHISSSAKHRPHSPNALYNGQSVYYPSQGSMAIPVYAEAKSGGRRNDGAVYFDGPLTFGFPLPQHAYTCAPTMAYPPGPEFTAYLPPPPYAMLPFIYPTQQQHNAQH